MYIAHDVPKKNSLVHYVARMTPKQSNTPTVKTKNRSSRLDYTCDLEIQRFQRTSSRVSNSNDQDEKICRSLYCTISSSTSRHLVEMCQFRDRRSFSTSFVSHIAGRKCTTSRGIYGSQSLVVDCCFVRYHRHLTFFHSETHG